VANLIRVATVRERFSNMLASNFVSCPVLVSGVRLVDMIRQAHDDDILRVAGVEEE